VRRGVIVEHLPLASENGLLLPEENVRSSIGPRLAVGQAEASDSFLHSNSHLVLGLEWTIPISVHCVLHPSVEVTQLDSPQRL
jgi:hypothetical protein